jgi:non-heme chloroperoxidase
MSTVDVNGVSLYYEDQGTGDPVVFCHGIPTDYRAWQDQMGPLSKNYWTIAYSRRYAHPNQRQGDLYDSTVENNASDLAGLIEKLGISPVHLVGHSYGGYIAAYLAAEHPNLVRTLVAVEPAVSTLLVENAESKAQMLSLLLHSPSVALSARRFQNRSLRPSFKALDAGQFEKATELNVDGVEDQPGTFRSFSEDVKRMMVDNARTIGELRTHFPSFKSRIGKISCRTLVINGERSPLWLRRIGELFASHVPNSERIMISNSRHFPHMENSTEFNERILGFISKNSQ